MDADRGRVASSLFPVKDLQRVLMKGEKEHQLTPLFAMHAIHHYYPLLESFLTSNAMVIHIPFKSKDDFDALHIQPFPLSVNGWVMIMDLPASVVLIRKDFSLFATWQFSGLGACITEYYDLYLCSASLFALLPLKGGVCEMVMTRRMLQKL